jgi:hypothetical protein
MTTGGWRLYNVYLIVGMGLFFVLAFFGPHPPEPEYWQEFAHYDPALVEGGMVRGTVQYSSSADCSHKARQRYHYEWVDIVGAIPMPANGIDSPYLWGCQRVNRQGQRLQDIKR